MQIHRFFFSSIVVLCFQYAISSAVEGEEEPNPQNRPIDLGESRIPAEPPVQVEVTEAYLEANRLRFAMIRRGIQWIREKQLDDGSWSYNAGGADAAIIRPMESTAFSLFALLRTTSPNGTDANRKSIAKAATFLIGKQSKDGDLQGPDKSVFAHIIATTALCEAHRQFDSDAIKVSATAALRRLTEIQHQKNGGWGPRERPSDMYHTAWSFVGMKRAHFAGLSVEPRTVAGGMFFLDSVQTSDGAAYGRSSQVKDPQATSMGLLCRNLVGWKGEHPTLKKGAMDIANLAPGKDPVFDVFATHVINQVGGKVWNDWNSALTKKYSDSQQTDGSWRSSENSKSHGGRLFETVHRVFALQVPCLTE